MDMSKFTQPVDLMVVTATVRYGAPAWCVTRRVRPLGLRRTIFATSQGMLHVVGNWNGAIRFRVSKKLKGRA